MAVINRITPPRMVLLLSVLLLVLVQSSFIVAFQPPQEPLLHTPPRSVLRDRYILGRATKRVAIIGAGPAGSSLALHLSNLTSQQQSSHQVALSIHIYDPYTRPGGRATTVSLYSPHNDQIAELGAAIFVPANTHLVSASERYNLQVSSAQSTPAPGPRLGIFDGQRFVFAFAPSNSWSSLPSFLYRYGIVAPFRTRTLVRETLAAFLSLYNAPIRGFDDLASAVRRAGLEELLTSSATSVLERKGAGGRWGWEVIQAATRVNYAQNIGTGGLHGLGATVCMATEGAMGVDAGNWLLFEGMVQESGAERRFGRRVTSVRQVRSGGRTVYKVRSQALEMPGSVMNTDDASYPEEEYDTVVLAHPFHQSGISYEPPLEHVPANIPFVHLHVTLFTSTRLLSPTFFGLSPDEAVPDTILTTLPPGSEASDGVGPAGFFSISTLRKVRNPAHGGRPEILYKIFSPTAIDDSFLSVLLGGEDAEDGGVVTWVFRKEWESYPYLTPLDARREDLGLPRVRLDNVGVYYTGGMESVISTMESSALMGANVAEVIVRDWADEELRMRRSLDRTGSGTGK